MSFCKTYRFKFSEDITSILIQFSKIHMHEDLQDYNHNWELWLLENDDSIKREEARLMEIGYEGDINKKLYKSARYYFRKKKDNTNENNENNEKEKRREYILASNEFLEAIDMHINSHVKNSSLSPAKAYDDFCKKNHILLSTEIISMKEENQFTNSYIYSKLKKTYKNRHFYMLKLNK